MATKLIRTSTAKGDIDNAFRMWESAMAMAGDPLAFDEACQAKARVKAWLAQVDTGTAQLHKAMLACQALDEANDDADVRAATNLAREAIEG